MMSLSKMSETQRKRASNFTTQENNLLIKLVKKYPDINSKLVDRHSNRTKIRSWQELAKDFNAEMGGQPFRTPIVLRHRYKNIKRLFLRPNQNSIHQPSTSNSSLENLTTFTESNGQVDDDDGGNNSKENIFNIKHFISPIDNDNDQSQDNTDMTNNFTPNNTQRKSLILDNLIDMQKKCFLEEHDLKLIHMKKKHELELELIRQEHQERLTMLKQEHDLKMELLEFERGVSIINKI